MTTRRFVGASNVTVIPILNADFLILVLVIHMCVYASMYVPGGGEGKRMKNDRKSNGYRVKMTSAVADRTFIFWSGVKCPF